MQWAQELPAQLCALGEAGPNQADRGLGEAGLRVRLPAGRSSGHQRTPPFATGSAAVPVAAGEQEEEDDCQLVFATWSAAQVRLGASLRPQQLLFSHMPIVRLDKSLLCSQRRVGRVYRGGPSPSAPVVDLEAIPLPPAGPPSEPLLSGPAGLTLLLAVVVLLRGALPLISLQSPRL